MEYKASPIRILLAIAITNAAGFTLKYFGLDTFVILLGFRFHLSAFLPLLIVIKKDHLSLIKNSFRHPAAVQSGKVLLTISISILLFIIILLITRILEIGDPEYFYELGLSSIVDYPIYLIWNSIQLMFIYLFFLIVDRSFKYNFIMIFLSSILIFCYEFIPIKKMIFSVEEITAVVLICLIIAVIIEFFRNIYVFVVLTFSIIWLSLLSFGTSSSMLTNIFLAARYNEWEGFFNVDKNISNFIYPAIYLLIILTLLILNLVRKRKSA